MLCSRSRTLSNTIPLKSKFTRFAGSLAADRPAGWRLRPAEAKGHAGHDTDELVCRPQGRRRRIGRSAAAIATLASSTAGAAEQSAPALRQIVLDAHRGLAQHEIAFLALAAGAVLFAIVTAIVLVRTRRRVARLLAFVRDETAALREEADRAKAPSVVRTAGRDRLARGVRRARRRGRSGSAWSARWTRAPGLGPLVDPGKAAAMARAVKALARGEPFSMALSTPAGHPMEHGRAVGGHVVLRLKDAGGIKRELVELLERYENLAAEAVALRAVVETLPSPVWTRNAAGRMTSSMPPMRARSRQRAPPRRSTAAWSFSIRRRRKRCAGAARRPCLLRTAAHGRWRRAANLRRARFRYRSGQCRHRRRCDRS